jgi:hypothetical protein
MGPPLHDRYRPQAVLQRRNILHSTASDISIVNLWVGIRVWGQSTDDASEGAAWSSTESFNAHAPGKGLC